MIRRLSPLLVSAMILAGCRTSAPAAAPPPPDSPLLFRDVAEQAGIRFRHTRGESGAHYLPETMGPGCMFFDYDGDGWADVLLVQGAALPGSPAGLDTRERLFRNLRDGRFEEVEGAGGLQDNGYGMGCAAADIDNDGDLDVVITNFRGCSLFRNDGGRFTNVTAASGLNRDGWAASAAFGDYDRDGRVDLFVTHYVEYEPGVSPGCKAPDGSPGYCPPEVYPATRDHLYRNVGGGRFRDVSGESGISTLLTRGLGVLWTDYDRDGYPDIYVACDQSPNVLWRNRRNGTFENVSARLGCAYDDRGEILNGMGVDAADPDHDGDQDLFITNFSGQPNSFYENLDTRGFRFASENAGLAGPSIRALGFGCNFLDYDGDGWEDLFVANGHVNDHIAMAVPDLTYAQPASLYRNEGRGVYVPVTLPAGQGLGRAQVSRGSAVGDYDQDGDPDLLVTNSGGPAELFRNERAGGGHWLSLRLRGTRSNRSAIGARIQVVTDTTQTREVRSGSSYLSQGDLVQTFALGKRSRAGQVRIEWPSGRHTVIKDVPGGRILDVQEPGS